jgi:hypothetical protein
MFIRFDGSQYYPNGGAFDLHTAHTTLDEACSQPLLSDWAHVADTADGDIRVVAYWAPNLSEQQVASALRHFVKIPAKDIIDGYAGDGWHRALFTNA